MFNLPMKFPAGRLVVFEGLDDTGKSTQLARFEEACYTPQMGEPLYEPTPMFTHQPSGATGIGPDIYDLTERVDWTQADSLTRQLLHLAAHNEHYIHDIIPALEKRSVVMDRCWWSAYAYGYRGSIADRMTKQDYLDLCQLPTQGQMPDLVFLFTHSYSQKASSVRAVSDRATMRNYLWLHDRYKNICRIVPNEGPGAVTAFIAGELYKSGFAATD